MSNLLQETIESLKATGKTPADVLWCGSPDFGHFTWEVFARLADKEYYDGYGSPAVCTDLLVVGKDFWLERHEYDGSEWWEYKTTPQKPAKTHNPAVIVDDSVMWQTLEESNRPGGKYGKSDSKEQL